MPPKLTNPLRPVARYRKGQAPAGVIVASDSDSDDDQDNDEQGQVGQDDEIDQVEIKDELVEDEPGRARGRAAGGRMDVKLRQVEVDGRGAVKIGRKAEVGRTRAEQEQDEDSSEYETDSEDEKPAAKPVFKPKLPAAAGAESEGSSEYETDSEEEEEAPKPIYKPVFVSKRNRDTIAERDAELDPEVIEARRVAEAEERKKQSHDLVAESVLRELADKDVEDKFPDVDDTDGLDPEAEFEAWKLRELMRIKRDKEALYAREKEREEVEARRALPEAIRFKEDMERADKSRKDKPKGQQVFLQKYHHKGAFYTDDAILKKHDYTAPTVGTVLDKSALPAAMQKRDFGKRSQSKYTHLAAEDTTKQDAGWARKTGAGAGGSGVCFNCGGPHLKRDCPQLTAGGLSGPSGSNGRDEGWGSRRPGGADRGDRDREQDRGYERGGDRQRDRYTARDDGRMGRGPADDRNSDRSRDADRHRDRDRDRDRDSYRRDYQERDRFGPARGSDERRRRSRSRSRDRISTDRRRDERSQSPHTTRRKHEGLGAGYRRSGVGAERDREGDRGDREEDERDDKRRRLD